MGRNLLVCTDGTWNEMNQLHQERMAPTNVVKFMRAVDRSNPNCKIFYATGIGGAGRGKYYSGLTGRGILAQIIMSYSFLSDHYTPGDSIYLFGFSRGAYAVRALAGFIYKVGGIIDTKWLNGSVLQKENAYSHYSTDFLISLLYAKDKSAIDILKKDALFHKPNIEMIGVWDTVGRLGLPIKIPALRHKHFFKKNSLKESIFLDYTSILDVNINSYIKSAYHALAIDEDRKIFAPVLFDNSSIESGQIVKQVWFSGNHCNVGGGYVDTGLSDTALRWMIEKAKEHGLPFRENYISKFILPEPLYSRIYNERNTIWRRMLYEKEARDIEKLCKEANTPIIVSRSVYDRGINNFYRPKANLNFYNVDETLIDY